MISYILRRTLYMFPLLIMVSFISFVVINLPPGDYLSYFQQQMQSRANLTQSEAEKITEEMREIYGLDRPFFIQYFSWISQIIISADFGYSFTYRKQVSEVIWDRLAWTMLIAFSSLILSLVIGVLIGIYSATHQYSFLDNFFTAGAFLGMSTPPFFLALLFMYVLAFYFKINVGGLFSPEYVMAPWSKAKILDLLSHIWIPIVVVSIAGLARNMRVMRGNLLDVLHQQFIQAARAKGLSNTVVIFKHAVRNALQPVIMALGMAMPFIFQGSIIVSIVLSLPTTGPMFYNALTNQDMYLAGSFMLLIATILVIGNLLADILLAWVDPRIKYE